MGFPKLFASAIVIVALTASSDHAQEPTPPTAKFRARVELITIDVAAVDKDGRPVEDLRAGDFAVKVDGRNRSVVSAQLVKVDRSHGGPSVAES